MSPAQPVPPGPQVGIILLNYHEPEATLACVRRMLAAEPEDVRILWLEQDIEVTRAPVLALLEASGIPWVELDRDTGPLPGPGQIGLITIREDLGYGAGNNVGIRFLRRHGVPYGWVMSNDAVVVKGSSVQLREAAAARPEVALWGMGIKTGDGPMCHAWHLQEADFATQGRPGPALLETDPMAYVSGCSLFFPTDRVAALGGIPEDYFLYFEDAALNWEVRRAGHAVASVDTVEIEHVGSMTNGRRSNWTEYYCRRNRWHFIQRYFPERLAGQTFRFYAYQLQKLFFRGRFDRIRLEWQAYADFRAGRLGMTDRKL